MSTKASANNFTDPHISFEHLKERYKDFNPADTTAHKTFLTFMENAPLVCWIKDENLSYLFVNSRWKSDITPQVDPIGKTDSDIFPASIAEGFRANDLQVITKQEPLQTIEKAKVDFESYQESLVFKFPLYHEGKTWVGGMAIDLTSKKRLEHDLQKKTADLERKNKELQEKEASLQLLMRDYQLLNRQLSLTNSELLQKQEDHTKTIGELEERNLELDNLIYRISHDMRGPISSMSGLLNLIELQPEYTSTYVPLITDRIDKLNQFISTILQFSAAGRQRSHLEVVDFAAIIENCKDELAHIKSPVDLTYTIGPSAESLAFLGSPLKLKCILYNLLSNSFLYYDEYKDTQVVNIFIYRNNQNELEIRVTDNGIGIEPDTLHKVWNMFYRGTVQSQGSGLGLYLVEQMVKQLGGSQSIRSKMGSGTTCTIALPILSKPTNKRKLAPVSYPSML